MPKIDDANFEKQMRAFVKADAKNDKGNKEGKPLTDEQKQQAFDIAMSEFSKINHEKE